MNFKMFLWVSVASLSIFSGNNFIIGVFCSESRVCVLGLWPRLDNELFGILINKYINVNCDVICEIPDLPYRPGESNSY